MTIDKFLGGRIVVHQPKDGFRAGTDTVMLAAFVPAISGQSVWELGAGSGVALCCLGARVSGLNLSGVEIGSENVDRANQNLARNNLSGEVVLGDALAPDKIIRQQQYDHVMLNPPFFDAGAHSRPNDDGKTAAHIAQAGAAKWVQAGCKRVRPGGWLTLVHRAAALNDCLAGMRDMGNIYILPISAKTGDRAKTLLIRAQRQSRKPLSLLAPLVMFNDDGTPSQRAKEITAKAAAIDPDHSHSPSA